MDRLDHVLDTATPLLRRAEAIIGAAGAPVDHPLWGHLRQVGLMPADAAQAVAGLRPTALAGADVELRAGARVCAEVAASLPAPGDWEGDAADAYDDQRRRVGGHLSGTGESLDERFEATADLAAALGDWMTRTRDELASALAEALTSAEAITLAAPASHLPSVAEARAAADLAAHILGVVATGYAEAEDLLRGSQELAIPVPL
ncbi:hypothetical protein [Actinoplanes sp. M2I2]|uniref:hypothetical protein n=1 Tax=Actinoplanes sp. M2I2 TaxID=1734444 RepID=UPI00202195AA|nr:hypothetical protein [Actinoplanes sp. M2I2]